MGIGETLIFQKKTLILFGFLWRRQWRLLI